MKSREEIEERLAIVYRAELEKYKRKFSKRSCDNCVFMKDGVCTNLDKNFSGVYKVGENTAESCGSFSNRTKDIDQSFLSIVKDPSACGRHFPKIATLIWVLKDFDYDYLNQKSSILDKLMFWRRK